MGKGATWPASPIKRGGGGRPNQSPLPPPPPPLLPYAAGLGEALGFFLHHHHHAVVLLDVGGDLPHLRCPLERERKELHRHHHGAPSINFNQFLEKEKLKGNGSNFTDWSRHVRIFLTGVSRQFVLEAPLGPPPPPAVSEDIKNVYETRVTRYSEVQCAILCSLEAELQKRFEHHDPCEMMRELKLIFETHAVESYEASKQFFNCMMEEGSSVSEHMFAMSGHAKKLSDLGIVIPNKLEHEQRVTELFSMLKSAEVEIKKENQVLMVNKTTSFKKQGKPNKGNFKKGGKKVAAPLRSLRLVLSLSLCATTARGRGTKRNCPKYLADLKSGHAKKKVSWSSSKQCTVAKSSTESEYIAASEASSEAVWMKRFIVELGVVPSALDPLVIYCDNTGAIANAKEPRSHKKLKHIKLRFHSIREYIEDGEVEICKVHTDLNVADPLTKALPRAKHDQHQNAMGVRYLTM
ncbi:hypothetical protein QYE76_029560 [Lolium multiflorum]|uniref:Retrotransposon protein, putative, Ty1-copia subclass n=1 Tax=Lolium multiflorum TaxID=4521 RepID=A0AAD8QNU1_LOLMU|nr:hypothetical protein QYE76_029560 [Lolium multiflorum]